MQQQQLDYYGSTDTVARGRSTIGRLFAISALVIPILTFLLLIVVSVGAGENEPQLRFVFLASLFFSAGSGIIALCGIPWWGERGVWVPALLGVAVSTFLFLIAQYG